MSNKNVGKIFENQFKKSVPDYCCLERFKDTAQAYNVAKTTRFTHKNPCDYFMFDSHSKILYYFELKTTKSKSISFEDIEIDTKQNRMIHKHQIIGLVDRAKYEGVLPAFIFNFRDELTGNERTYYQYINDFMKMYYAIKQKKLSLNEIDLLRYNAIKIKGVKKRVHYIWDIDELLTNINQEMRG